MNNHSSACDEFVDGFVVERYATGGLSKRESAAFEEHLLVCERCQRELTLAVAAREAFREIDAAHSTASWLGGRRRVGLGLALATAAAIAAIVILPADRVSGPISQLGRVTQPPIYLGVSVRQAPARPDSVFGVGMEAYGAGNYGAAIIQLESAMAAGADSAAAQFFRGASLLMLGKSEGAAVAFEAVLSSGESPYVPEAHYYLAKALLRQGSTGRALSELRAVGRSAGEISIQARALADSVEAITEE